MHRAATGSSGSLLSHCSRAEKLPQLFPRVEPFSPPIPINPQTTPHGTHADNLRCVRMRIP